MALSWKQPYGNLMFHGKVETRTWPTNYRGWVMICASKTSYKSHQIWSISGTNQFGRISNQLLHSGSFMHKFRGHAIGVGKLVDCRKMTKSDEDICFVEFHPNLYCHIYENVRAIVPIPWKGTQGWKEVNEEYKSKIEFIK